MTVTMMCEAGKRGTIIHNFVFKNLCEYITQKPFELALSDVAYEMYKDFFKNYVEKDYFITIRFIILAKDDLNDTFLAEASTNVLSVFYDLFRFRLQNNEALSKYELRVKIFSRPENHTTLANNNPKS